MPTRPACCPIARNLGKLVLVALVATGLFVTVRAISAEEHAHERPKNAVVLFDGKDLSKWQTTKGGGEAKWKIVDGGAMEVTRGGGDIQTKESFPDDFVLHVEFMPPDMGPDAKGQARGNSGIYLQDNYEIQVLDSYGITKLEPGDCAGIYAKKPADKNVSKPPGEWQTYDITFKAPKFDADGKKTKNARVTVEWNGQRVHDDVEIDGVCPGGVGEKPGMGPFRLQDHGNPVRFRNIWVAPLSGK